MLLLVSPSPVQCWLGWWVEVLNVLLNKNVLYFPFSVDGEKNWLTFARQQVHPQIGSWFDVLVGVACNPGWGQTATAVFTQEYSIQASMLTKMKVLLFFVKCLWEDFLFSVFCCWVHSSTHPLSLLISFQWMVSVKASGLCPLRWWTSVKQNWSGLKPEDFSSLLLSGICPFLGRTLGEWIGL